MLMFYVYVYIYHIPYIIYHILYIYFCTGRALSGLATMAWAKMGTDNYIISIHGWLMIMVMYEWINFNYDHGLFGKTCS